MIKTENFPILKVWSDNTKISRWKREGKENPNELLQLISERTFSCSLGLGTPWQCGREDWQGPLQKYIPRAAPETFAPSWGLTANTLSPGHSPPAFPFITYSHFNNVSPEWTQQSLISPISPYTLWLHISFPYLLSPEPLRSNFNQFMASPSRFSFYFCKMQILSQFNNLPTQELLRKCYCAKTIRL